MNKEQAFGLIDQVCARFQGTRADHEALVQALTIIRAIVFPEPVVSEPEVQVIPPSEADA